MDFFATSEDGDTCLHQAAFQNQVGCLQLVLNHPRAQQPVPASHIKASDMSVDRAQAALASRVHPPVGFSLTTIVCCRGCRGTTSRGGAQWLGCRPQFD